MWLQVCWISRDSEILVCWLGYEDTWVLYEWMHEEIQECSVDNVKENYIGNWVDSTN